MAEETKMYCVDKISFKDTSNLVDNYHYFNSAIGQIEYFDMDYKKTDESKDAKTIFTEKLEGHIKNLNNDNDQFPTDEELAKEEIYAIFVDSDGQYKDKDINLEKQKNCWYSKYNFNTRGENPLQTECKIIKKQIFNIDLTKLSIDEIREYCYKCELDFSTEIQEGGLKIEKKPNIYKANYSMDFDSTKSSFSGYFGKYSEICGWHCIANEHELGFEQNIISSANDAEKYNDVLNFRKYISKYVQILNPELFLDTLKYDEKEYKFAKREIHVSNQTFDYINGPSDSKFRIQCYDGNDQPLDDYSKYYFLSDKNGVGEEPVGEESDGDHIFVNRDGTIDIRNTTNGTYDIYICTKPETQIDEFSIINKCKVTIENKTIEAPILSYGPIDPRGDKIKVIVTNNSNWICNKFYLKVEEGTGSPIEFKEISDLSHEYDGTSADIDRSEYDVIRITAYSISSEYKMKSKYSEPIIIGS